VKIVDASYGDAAVVQGIFKQEALVRPIPPRGICKLAFPDSTIQQYHLKYSEFRQPGFSNPNGDALAKQDYRDRRHFPISDCIGTLKIDRTSG
jgi:hypothetical protein